jgi:prepilin-type processing-associated H-X9-DG protein
MHTNTPRLPSWPRPAAQAAFTKIDLLAVLLVISLLAVFRFTALAGWKNQTKIAQCAGNLRQLSLTVLLYGNEYNDKLPSPERPAGFWLWDLDWNVGLSLNQFGAPQQIMYCPGTAPRFAPADNVDLYQNFAAGLFHVIGYAPTLPFSPTLVATNMNATVTPQPIRSGTLTLPPPIASQRVLIADATLANPAGNYVDIPGGYPKAHHLSAHLNGLIPAGGNLGMLDGHVEWRAFDLMQKRTDSSTPGSGPAFYW